MAKTWEDFDCENCKKDECDGCATPQPRTGKKKVAKKKIVKKAVAGGGLKPKKKKKRKLR